MTYAGPIQGDLPGQVALRAWAEERAQYWASPPVGTCPSCSTEDMLLVEEGGSCASCYRKTARRHQAEMFYPCDNCGAEEAFRDPAHRRDEYLCPACHLENGYEPSERGMLNKTAARIGVKHSMGRKAVCTLRASGTPCGGEIKQRGKHGEICNRHWNPKKYDANKQE